MAIQNRRGLKAKLDTNKLLPGEFAIPTDSKEIYVAFAPGDVKRMATYEDMVDNIADATNEIRTAFSAGVTTAIESANIAISNANIVTTKTNEALQNADAIIQEAAIIIDTNLATKADQAALNITNANVVTNTAMIADMKNGAVSGSLQAQVTTVNTNIATKADKTALDATNTNLGILSSLTTTVKSSVVNAINELRTSITSILTSVETLTSLTTTIKTSIVNSINEVKASTITNATSIATINTNLAKTIVLTFTVTTSGTSQVIMGVNSFAAVVDLTTLSGFPTGKTILGVTPTWGWSSNGQICITQSVYDNPYQQMSIFGSANTTFTGKVVVIYK